MGFRSVGNRWLWAIADYRRFGLDLNLLGDFIGRFTEKVGDDTTVTERLMLLLFGYLIGHPKEQFSQEKEIQRFLHLCAFSIGIDNVHPPSTQNMTSSKTPSISPSDSTMIYSK